MAKSASERKFGQDVKRVSKSLKAYIHDPENEKNIHDIRVSIRRLDVAFSLLPKKVRRHYRGKIGKYKELLRANSNARDSDIIANRLAALGASSDAADIREKKKTKLGKAIGLARSLKKLPWGLAGVPDCKRVDKQASRLVNKIKETLPLVLMDSRRVEELHRFRVNLRKLRYILDLVPTDMRKPYMKNVAGVLGKGLDLGELQDLLGSIHDCDITIEYLRERPDAAGFLDREISNRRKLYQRLITYVKT